MIETNVSGHRFCTYRVGGTIDQLAQPKSLDEAVAVLQHVRSQGLPLTVLGSGSNTIIASNGIRGLTLNTKALSSLSELSPTDYVLGAGWPMARAAKFFQSKGLTGAEFWIGIPGTLGGAVAMNAGAMGQETAELVTKVTLFNMSTAELEVWDKEALAFSYRKSAIHPDEHVVLELQLSLKAGVQETIDDLMSKSLVFRQSHHPKDPNGGSVFKNPSKEQPAGLLLDKLGVKSWHEGGAKVSDLHANFIVNTGQATSTDVLRLMRRMKQAVRDAYALELWPENRFLGDASPEEQSVWKELTDYACTQVA